MDEESANTPPRRYRWPWVVMIAVVLWLVLDVVWVSVAARHVREQTNFSAPLPTNSAH